MKENHPISSLHSCGWGPRPGGLDLGRKGGVLSVSGFRPRIHKFKFFYGLRPQSQGDPYLFFGSLRGKRGLPPKPPGYSYDCHWFDIGVRPFSFRSTSGRTRTSACPSGSSYCSVGASFSLDSITKCIMWVRVENARLAGKLRFLAGGQKILRSEQNFGTTPTHELLFALVCSVAICENLKWFGGTPLPHWILTFS
jgi:hypothetical protein